jgi:heme a synthase
MRVTEMSDALAIFHGCLGQIFFCLLLVIAMMSSPSFGSSPRWLPVRVRSSQMAWSSTLLGAVFLQLVWGATVRHLHRVGLPAHDFITTNGRIFPGLGDPALFFFFLHKAWAFVVVALAVFVAWRTLRCQSDGADVRPLRRLSITIIGLLAAQVALGIAVVLTNTSFWVTNFHVLNGLAILACGVASVVKVVAATPQAGMVAGPLASLPQPV